MEKSLKEQTRVVIIIFKKELEKRSKEHPVTKFLTTNEKLLEKDNITANLEEDLVCYEMQNLTVGHQKETIVHMEADVTFLKTQFFKVIDDLI